MSEKKSLENTSTEKSPSSSLNTQLIPTVSSTSSPSVPPIDSSSRKNLHFIRQTSTLIEELKKVQKRWELERVAIVQKWAQNQDTWTKEKEEFQESIQLLKNNSKEDSDKIRNLSLNVESLTADNNTLKNKLSEWEKNDRTKELMPLISALQSKLDSAADSSLELENINLKKSIDNLKSDYENTLTDLKASLKEKEAEALKSYTSLASIRIQWGEKLAKYNEMEKNFQKERLIFEDQILNHRNSILQLQAIVDSKGKAKCEECPKLRNHLLQANDTIKKLQNEISNSSDRYVKINDILLQAQDTIKTLQMQNQQLTSDVSKRDKLINEIKTGLETSSPNRDETRSPMALSDDGELPPIEENSEKELPPVEENS